eukprot:c15808_g1_i1.p1 GENE.c15808_g1_i1~~c15808_g1_i1.p1  ORF type:complete len:483 (-),score=124.69 c15808_g1_i1:26-1474(-)
MFLIQLFILFCLNYFIIGFEIISPSDLNNTRISSSLFSEYVGPILFNTIEGGLVLDSEDTTCHNGGSEVFRGKILLFIEPSDCWTYAISQEVEKYGGIGVIHVATLPFKKGVGIRSNFLRSPSISIPVVDVDGYDVNMLIQRLKTGEEVVVRISDDNLSSPFIEYFDSVLTILFIRVGLTLANIICIILIIFITKKFLNAKPNLKKHLSFSIIFSTLGIELFSCLCRLIVCSVDPIFSTGLLSFEVGLMLQSLMAPVSMATTILSAISFRHILSGTFLRLTKLNKLSIAFSIITICWEFMISMFRVTLVMNTGSRRLQIFYFSVTYVTIFIGSISSYIWCARHLIKKFNLLMNVRAHEKDFFSEKTSVKILDSDRKLLVDFSILFVIGAISRIIAFLTLVSFLTASEYSPTIWILSCSFQIASLTLSSFTVILTLNKFFSPSLNSLHSIELFRKFSEQVPYNRSSTNNSNNNKTITKTINNK